MNDPRNNLLDAGWRDDTSGLSYLIDMFRRQYLVLILTPLAFLVAGLIFLVSVPPQFTATASLHVRLDQPGLTDDLSPLNTHAELIQSNRITNEVIDELGLAEILEPNPSRLSQAIAGTRRWLRLEARENWAVADDESLLISKVQKGLTVERVGDSSMIAVGFTSSQRPLAVDIANAFASIYVQDVTASAERSLAQRKENLENRAEQMRSQAVTAQDTARRLISQSNYIVTNADDLENRIVEFQQQLSNSNANEAEVKARLALLSQTGGIDTLQAPALQDDETLELYSDMLSASRKLEQFRNQPGVSKDTLARLEESVDGMRASLERAVRHIRDDLELELAVLAARNTAVQNELNAIQEYGDSTEWAHLLEAQRSAVIFDRIYQQHLNELENLKRSDVSPDVRLASEARPPINPSFPKYKVILVLFLLFGILTGVGLAMAREWAAKDGLRPGSKLGGRRPQR